nr:MAG TPA: hypothetical protein [Caudoviricetes sp.]
MHNVLEKHEKFSKTGGGTKRIPRRAKEPPGVQMRVATDEIRVRVWMELNLWNL